MAVNRRFAMGVRTVVLLAQEPDSLHTSQDIAAQLHTNPVVVRRVLAALQKAAIVTSQKGPSGGSKLARAARSISLRDVYRAVEPGPLFHVQIHGAGDRMGSALSRLFAETQSSLEQQLDEIRISQLLKKHSRKGKK
jgi:Rrf2 family protein